MKTLLVNIFILFCTQLCGQLLVDTQLSVKDSVIIVNLQNKSDYRMLISPIEYLSEVKFFFIDVKGDTVRRNLHSYGEYRRDLIFQPKETKRIRYLRLEKINFQGLRSIKVNHAITYVLNDTIFLREKGRYPRYQYSDEVVFDIRKILHPGCELKNE